MNKKILYLSIVGTLLIALVCGAAYSLWVSSIDQANENIADTGCFDVSLNDGDSLLIDGDYPKIDKDGIKGDPYTFSIENTCSVYAAYQIKVDVLSDNTLPATLTKVAIDSDIYLLSELDNTSGNFYVIKSGQLAPGEVKELEFRQWVDESGTLDNSQDKIISLRIVLEAVATSPSLYSDSLLAGNDPILNSGFVPVVIENDGTVKKADLHSEWYNYKNKEWANAVTVNSDDLRDASAGTVIPMDNIEEMYVWIPRYAYDAESIIDADHAIDIEFVDVDSSAHPAFTVDGVSLNGMWVGKFEMGFKDGENEVTANVEHLIKPNLNSAHAHNVSTLFTKIGNINNTNGLDSSSDVHMIKNIEWGAVAYLSQSIYGVCSSIDECAKVNNNNYYNPKTFDIVTGCGGTDSFVSSTETGLSICPESNRWTSEFGMTASTTRNITGIYDMAGGRSELAMGNMLDTNGNFYPGSSGFTSAPLAKYYDVYDNGSRGLDFFRGHVGDATIELNPVNSDMSNWNGDSANVVYSTSPWFRRGGRTDFGSDSGIWFFLASGGGAFTDNTSRAVVWSYTE